MYLLNYRIQEIINVCKYNYKVFFWVIWYMTECRFKSILWITALVFIVICNGEKSIATIQNMTSSNLVSELDVRYVLNTNLNGVIDLLDSMSQC